MKSINNKALMLIIGIISLSACTKENENTDTVEEDVELEILLDDDGGSKTSVNISTDGKASNTSIADGKFSLKADGVDINIDLPKALLEKSNRSDDLYPGSKILGVDINSSNDNSSSETKAVVNLKFFAPDEPKKVAQYFANKFKDEGGSASLNGTNVSGKTKDGQDYKLSLNPDGNGSKGVLAITGDKDK